MALSAAPLSDVLHILGRGLAVHTPHHPLTSSGEEEDELERLAAFVGLDPEVLAESPASALIGALDRRVPRRTVGLVEMVEEVLRMLEPRFRRHAIGLARTYDGSPIVSARPASLLWTVLYLSMHADLSVPALFGHVEVDVGTRGHEAFVAVSHDGEPCPGRGIPSCLAVAARLATHAGGRLDSVASDSRIARIWLPLVRG
jgi:hypothetical protein